MSDCPGQVGGRIVIFITLNLAGSCPGQVPGRSWGIRLFLKFPQATILRNEECLGAMDKALKNTAIVGLILLVTAATLGQAAKSDISAVVAAGNLNGDVYENAYFGVRLTAPSAKFIAPSLVNVEGRRARLVNIVYDSPDGAKNYTIGLLADSLENYPRGMSTTVFVRSVRHQLEKEGLLTEREEFPARISGMDFIGSVLKVPEKPNFGHRRGIYAMFLNGYVFSLEVQARDDERIQQVLSAAVKIDSKWKPVNPAEIGS
jgi:hypothetical protein